MNKKLIYVICSILCVFVIVATAIKFTYSTDTDANKFKKEYEKYNKELISLKISRNNKIKYSDYKEVEEIIKGGTGIIYLGTPDSNWCRNVVNPLIDAVNDSSIDAIYYLDISKDMDYYTVEDGNLTYMIDDNGNELKGTDEYFSLVDALNDYLTEYKLILDDKEYTTENKRIYLPTVIFVKNGNIIDFHVSTVVSHIEEDKKLTKKEYKELYEIFESDILDITSDTCSIDKDGSGC